MLFGFFLSALVPYELVEFTKASLGADRGCWEVARIMTTMPVDHLAHENGEHHKLKINVQRVKRLDFGLSAEPTGNVLKIEWHAIFLLKILRFNLLIEE